MEDTSGRKLRTIRVDGGVTVNSLVMQTLADVLGVRVECRRDGRVHRARCRVPRRSRGGSVELAEDLPMLSGVARTYEPAPDADQRLADLKLRWAEGVRRSLKWERA
jgi:glycerol kinase